MNLFRLLTPKSEIKTLEDDCTIRQALEKMDVYKYTVVPLINKAGEYVGTLSEGDLLRFIKNDCDFSIVDAEGISIKQVKRYRSYLSLNQQASAAQLANLCVEQNFVPIVDDRNIFMGIITRSKIMKLCKESIFEAIENS